MGTRKNHKSKKSNKRFRKTRSKRQKGGNPSDWKEKKTIEGQTYYHNINTGTVQVERPPLTHEQQKKQHDKEQMIINNKKYEENKQRGNVLPSSTRHLIRPPQNYDLYNKYNEADKKVFKQIDENKDWGLTFGGKKSKRKTRKSKKKSKLFSRKGGTKSKRVVFKNCESDLDCTLDNPECDLKNNICVQKYDFIGGKTIKKKRGGRTIPPSTDNDNNPYLIISDNVEPIQDTDEDTDEDIDEDIDARIDTFKHGVIQVIEICLDIKEQREDEDEDEDKRPLSELSEEELQEEAKVCPELSFGEYIGYLEQFRDVINGLNHREKLDILDRANHVTSSFMARKQESLRFPEINRNEGIYYTHVVSNITVKLREKLGISRTGGKRKKSRKTRYLK